MIYIAGRIWFSGFAADAFSVKRDQLDMVAQQGWRLGLERLGLETVSRRFLRRLGLVSVSRLERLGLVSVSRPQRLGLVSVSWLKRLETNVSRDVTNAFLLPRLLDLNLRFQLFIALLCICLLVNN